MPNLSLTTGIPTQLQDPVKRGVTPFASTAGAVHALPPTRANGSVALSFAFDAQDKTLHVVIRDERSGEVVRTIAYTHLPQDVHRSDKLSGILLDQLA